MSVDFTPSIEASMKAHYAEVRNRLRNPQKRPPLVAMALPAPQVRPVNAIAAPVEPVWPKQHKPAPYDHCETNAGMPKTAKMIIAEVALKHKVPASAIIGPHRQPPVVAARHEAAFRIVTELGLTFPAAGRRLGNRDHTTILASVKRHIERNPEATEQYSNWFAGKVEKKAAQREELLAMYRSGMTPNAIYKLTGTNWWALLKVLESERSAA